jgi:hypothetical protein
MTGRRPLALLALVFGTALASPLLAADYHVDCRAGHDDRDGLSPETAWKTLDKANGPRLSPGDSILLRRGTRCTGTLRPKGSGDAERPVRLGAYGEGPLPVVEGGGSGAAVALFNQHHWHITALEVVGGDPYGIHIAGDRGTLEHVQVRDVVIRGVRGEPKSKVSGLLVVEARGEALLEDVMIEGVTAYDATQWAGIVVRGASPEVRARNVTVRNSIVHDVYGDGIILFQVENGLIEKSAAWRTGLQPRETIGTPNGIWTWRCRRCTVQWTEGFFIDSPGVDGGVYDIDWGNDDNVVQYNFGHDAMGYCAAVFGAGGEVTTNSVVRYNVCVNNGRSPKLALRQGDLFISTWEKGALDGVRIYNNTFYWNPPIDAPVLMMDHADFTGDRPNVFENNLIDSTVPRMIHSNDGLRFDHNLYWYTGERPPRWSYGGREYEGFSAYRQGSGQDGASLVARPELTATLRPGPASPARDAGAAVPGSPGRDVYGTPVPRGAAPDIGAVERAASTPSGEPRPALGQFRGRFALVSHLGVDESSRSQLVFLQSALEQYGERGLEVAVALHGEVPANIAWDWNLGRIRPLAPASPRDATLPTTLLVGPDGRVLRRWEGLVPLADLGLTLRSLIGPPGGSPTVERPPDPFLAAPGSE